MTNRKGDWLVGKHPVAWDAGYFSASVGLNWLGLNGLANLFPNAMASGGALAAHYAQKFPIVGSVPRIILMAIGAYYAKEVYDALNAGGIPNYINAAVKAPFVYQTLRDAFG
jgi:hypothetical protein